MIETGVTEGINKFYFILKLTLYFWALSISRGVIFGVGPAFLTIMALFGEYGWDHSKVTWKNLYPEFKKEFKFGNQLFYSFFLIGLFLFLSLWTSVQLKGMLFLMTDFILIFLLLVVIIAGGFAFSLYSHYDISLKNLIKLSVILFFREFKAALSLVVFLVIMTVINLKMPAFIFFISAGVLALFLYRLGKKVSEGLVID